MKFFEAPLGAHGDRVRGRRFSSIRAVFAGALLAVVFAATTAPAPAQAQQGQWQNYFSDSTPVKSGFCSNGISGMRVDGTWAANNSFYCRFDDVGLRATADAHSQPPISEEAPNNSIQCPPQEAIVGMSCSGLYCDNVAVQCAPVDNSRFKLVESSCQWTGPISDSTTRQVTNSGVLTGMKCEGGYCVNKSLRFCQVAKVERKEGETLLNARWESICSGEGTCTASLTKSFSASKENETSISEAISTGISVAATVGAEGIFTSASVTTEASLSLERQTAQRILTAHSQGTDNGCQAEIMPKAGTALVWRRVIEGKILGYPMKMHTCLLTCTTDANAPNYGPGDFEGINACTGGNRSVTGVSAQTSVPATPAPAPNTPVIAVSVAHYGHNCPTPASGNNGYNPANTTRHVAAQCDGKSNCDYKIDFTLLGDPAPGCAKNYAVAFNCNLNGNQVDSGYVTAQGEAGLGSVVSLNCGPRLSIRQATYGANCGATPGNVTNRLQAACAHGSCTYTVDVAALGDPAPGCAKDFDVEYSCGSTAARKKIDAEANGKAVILACN